MSNAVELSFITARGLNANVVLSVSSIDADVRGEFKAGWRVHQAPPEVIDS
jgi:hypothetical protein